MSTDSCRAMYILPGKFQPSDLPPFREAKHSCQQHHSRKSEQKNDVWRNMDNFFPSQKTEIGTHARYSWRIVPNRLNDIGYFSYREKASSEQCENCNQNVREKIDDGLRIHPVTNRCQQSG